jgi:acyl carrier protein
MNGTEEKVAAIWRSVLRVEDIGTADEFIALGGDSVAAMLCLNLIQRDLGRQIPLPIFLRPDMTLGKLATLIDDVPAAAHSGEPRRSA